MQMQGQFALTNI